ncbi:MAG: apolipoprotein N-acyltransferase [Alphaproteobacteria bacterium]|nr:MAG: apolipoprotein N-acyltransferase [Alphaproteobacteria bacterium]
MIQGKTTDIILGWLARRTGLQNMGLLLLAGVLTAFSFAPFYLFPVLALCYPLLLLVLFRSRNFLEAISFGWWFGFGQFFTGLIWLATAFDVDDRYSGWTGYLAVAGLSVLLALFSGVVTGILWKMYRGKDPRNHSLSIVLSFVILWSLGEWARGNLFTGFPWNLAGYTWGFSDVMLQTTAIWGIYGLGLLTLLLALVPYILLQTAQRNTAFGVIASAVLVLGGMMAYGLVQLSEPTEFRDDVKLKVVQANINQKDKWDPKKKADNFIKHLRMSKSRPQEGITHVIWPETAVIYFLDTEPSRRFLIADVLGKNTQLMTGFPRVKRQPEFQAWNSFVMIDGQGAVRNIYDKYHLVPFGEYTPDILSNSLSFLGLGMMVEGFSYSRGDRIKTLHQDGMPPVGILICYEIIFSGQVVDQKDRPEWLLNITNDAWYGTFSGPYQHLIQTRVRAIEEGLPIVRSAGTGVSAVIDAFGRVVKSLSLNKQGVIVSPLPVMRDGATIYSKNSSWIFFGLMLLLAGFNILFQRH